jgi:hypothetical protein
VSDPVETTAAGATRSFLGIIAFILLMVGIEGITGAVELPPGLAFWLILTGGLCAYAAFFWETAKKVLSVEAQQAIGRFSQSQVTWFGMIFLVLATIIMSPFIEQRRWPFSYPVDPAIAAENNALKNQLNNKNADITKEKELADKWRFSAALRQSELNCQYELEWSRRASNTAAFWRELFIATGWTGSSKQMPLPLVVGKDGITIRSKDNPASTQCAEIIQRELTEFYSNPPAKIVSHQQTQFLDLCGRDACVQIELDY